MQSMKLVKYFKTPISLKNVQVYALKKLIWIRVASIELETPVFSELELSFGLPNNEPASNVKLICDKSFHVPE